MKTVVVRAAFNKEVIVLRLCLNKVYESSASTFAVNDQLKVGNDQGLVLLAQLGCGKRCANAG